MRAAMKDQGCLKQGRHYFCAVLKLKVAFADPARSLCFKHARQAFSETHKPTAIDAALMKTARSMLVSQRCGLIGWFFPTFGSAPNTY